MQSDANLLKLFERKPKKVGAGDALKGYALDRPGISAAKSDRRSPIALAALIAEALVKASSISEFVPPETFTERQPIEKSIDVKIKVGAVQRIFHGATSFVFLQEVGVGKEVDERIPQVPGLSFRVIQVKDVNKKSVEADSFIHTTTSGSKEKKATIVTSWPFTVVLGNFAKKEGGTVSSYLNLLAPVERMQDAAQNKAPASFVFPKEATPVLDTPTALLQGGVVMLIFDDAQLKWICSIDFDADRGRATLSAPAKTTTNSPPRAPPTIKSADKTAPPSPAGLSMTTLFRAASKGGGEKEEDPNLVLRAAASDFVGALVNGITRNAILVTELADLNYRPKYVATLRYLYASVEANLKATAQTFEPGRATLGVITDSSSSPVPFPSSGLRRTAVALLVAAALIRDYAVLAASSSARGPSHMPLNMAAHGIGNFAQAAFQAPKDNEERNEIASIMGGPLSPLAIYVEKSATAGAIWTAVVMALAQPRGEGNEEPTSYPSAIIAQLAIAISRMLHAEISRKATMSTLAISSEHVSLIRHLAIFLLESIAVAILRHGKPVGETEIYAILGRITLASNGETLEAAQAQRLTSELVNRLL